MTELFCRPPRICFRVVTLCLVLLVAGCTTVLKAPPPKPGIGEPVKWADVPGWETDRHAEIWPALLHNCQALSGKTPWDHICQTARTMSRPTDLQARQFFETLFSPHAFNGSTDKATGLATGYYEPLLFGSKTPSERYRYPLYKEPESLLTVDLGALYPALKGKRIRGRLLGKKIVPFYSRREIESDRSLLSGEELIWVDNRDDAFFLQIQGSGRVVLPDGQLVGVGYQNQNGHPYVPIGRVLLQQNEIKREDISLFSIRQWLDNHPDKAETLLNRNPSYVFFVLREQPQDGPIGSLNIPLTPQRSIAIDPGAIDLGTPVWLMTNQPGQPDIPYHRLVLAQDTGGAIKGTLRVDLFWGHGKAAERSAGIMKEPVRLIVLLPRPREKN